MKKIVSVNYTGASYVAQKALSDYASATKEVLDFHAIRVEATKQFKESHIVENAMTWHTWKRAFHAGYNLHDSPSSAPESGGEEYWEKRCLAAEKCIINEYNDGYKQEDYEAWYKLRKGFVPSVQSSDVKPSTSSNSIEQPKIVCLCGSVRFADEFHKQEFQWSVNGYIVLAPCAYNNDVQVNNPDAKKMFDYLHKHKIDLADEVFVLNVGGYIGESTRSEIDYAIAHNKPVKYLEPNSEQEDKRDSSLSKEERKDEQPDWEAIYDKYRAATMKNYDNLHAEIERLTGLIEKAFYYNEPQLASVWQQFAKENGLK